MINRWVFAAGLVLALTGGVRAADPVQPLSGEEIAALWKERQDKVHTASFEFTRTMFEPKGGLLKSNPPLIRMWRKSHPELGSDPIPPRDVRISSPARLLIDGIKVRHDYQSEQFDLGRREYYLRKEQGAFDGTHFRNINETKNGGDEGAVSKASYYPEANLVAVQALLTSIRGRTKGLTRIVADVRAITPTGRRTTIDGIECLEYLVEKQSDGRFIRHVWLAPTWGWQIVRHTALASKTDILDKHEFRYKPDPTVGWLPSTWEFARIQKGEVLLQTSFKLDSYSLNEPIPATEFVLKFPKGMNVMDEDATGGAVVGTVKDNGMIVPDDGRPAYYLPGNTEPSWRKFTRYGLYALIAFTATVLAWRLFRRINRPAPTSPHQPQPEGKGGPP